jgi:hypothetical protein
MKSHRIMPLAIVLGLGLAVSACDEKAADKPAAGEEKKDDKAEAMKADDKKAEEKAEDKAEDKPAKDDAEEKKDGDAAE